jgi:hypothetical protein
MKNQTNKRINHFLPYITESNIEKRKRKKNLSLNSTTSEIKEINISRRINFISTIYNHNTKIQLKKFFSTTNSPKINLNNNKKSPRINFSTENFPGIITKESIFLNRFFSLKNKKLKIKKNSLDKPRFMQETYISNKRNLFEQKKKINLIMTNHLSKIIEKLNIFKPFN